MFFFRFHIHVVSSDNLKWSSCFHLCLLNPFLLYMAGRCNFLKSQIISLHFPTLKIPKGISLDFKQKLSIASLLENLPETCFVHISTWLFHSQYLNLSLNITFRNITLSIVFSHSPFIIPWSFCLFYGPQIEPSGIVWIVYSFIVYHSPHWKIHETSNLTTLVYSLVYCCRL